MLVQAVALHKPEKLVKGLPTYVYVDALAGDPHNKKPATMRPRTLVFISKASGYQSWTRKFEQVDKWSFCLIAAMIAANRRDYEQKTAP